MKKILPFCILILFSNGVYAQTSKFSYDFIYNQSMAFRGNLEIDQLNQVGYTSEFSMALTSSFGLTINRHFSETITLSTGVIYETYGYNYFFDAVMFDSYSRIKIDGKTRLKYINLPIYLTRNYKNKTYIRFGLMNNCLVKIKDYSKDIESSEKAELSIYTFNDLIKSKTNRLYNPGLKVSYGLLKQLSPKVILILEPTFDFMLLSPSLQNSISTQKIRYFKLGLNIYLRFQNRT